MRSEYGVSLGLDLDKGEHYAVGLDAGRQAPARRATARTEARLRALVGKPARHGTVNVVVDQPASIGALPVAGACGYQVAYPGRPWLSR